MRIDKSRIIAPILFLLILVCVIIYTNFRAIPQCPIPYLSLREEIDRNEETILKVATDLEASIEALKSNIKIKGVRGSLNTEFKQKVDTRQLSILGGDSIFVGFYNAHVGVICSNWQIYSSHPSNQSADRVYNSVAKLEAFINTYYKDKSKTSINMTKETMELIDSVKKLKDEFYELRTFNFKAPADILYKRYYKKLEYFDLKLSQIDYHNYQLVDFYIIEEIGYNFLKLKPEIEQFLENLKIQIQ